MYDYDVVIIPKINYPLCLFSLKFSPYMIYKCVFTNKQDCLSLLSFFKYLALPFPLFFLLLCYSLQVLHKVDFTTFFCFQFLASSSSSPLPCCHPLRLDQPRLALNSCSFSSEFQNYRHARPQSASLQLNENDSKSYKSIKSKSHRRLWTGGFLNPPIGPRLSEQGHVYLAFHP